MRIRKDPSFKASCRKEGKKGGEHYIVEERKEGKMVGREGSRFQFLLLDRPEMPLYFIFTCGGM
jgi:hypothetical protein